MERSKGRTIAQAAMMAGMAEKTAAGYIHSGKLPSEQLTERDWRTREDPFNEVWPLAEARLMEAPELEGKALFECICEQFPGHFQEGQLRTFQRRIRLWRATNGPPKEVYFPQDHHPGERLAFDFTHMDKLSITIAGEPFSHLLFHAVLTYSNWQWVRICHSESLLAVRGGLQSTFLQLGHLPREVWSDNSTAATHEIGKDQPGKRGFNERYLELTDHFGLTPRTIQVDAPNENGDVESANGALKRRINQHLLLRGSRDFEDLDSYRRFLEEIVYKTNQMRSVRLREELAAMRPLNERLLNEYEEVHARVTSWSTVNVSRKTYSVPSQLIGEQVKVRLYEDRVEIWFAGKEQERIVRTPGRQHQINYRHIIDWLVRKPGAFGNYRYREDLFPHLQFRNVYDELCEKLPLRKADLEYLRILKLAAYNGESDVLEALEVLQERKMTPTLSHVEEFLPRREVSIPEMAVFEVNLGFYDQLFTGGGRHAE